MGAVQHPRAHAGQPHAPAPAPASRAPTPQGLASHKKNKPGTRLQELVKVDGAGAILVDVGNHLLDLLLLGLKAQRAHGHLELLQRGGRQAGGWGTRKMGWSAAWSGWGVQRSAGWEAGNGGRAGHGPCQHPLGYGAWQLRSTLHSLRRTDGPASCPLPWHQWCQSRRCQRGRTPRGSPVSAPR